MKKCQTETKLEIKKFTKSNKKLNGNLHQLIRWSIKDNIRFQRWDTGADHLVKENIKTGKTIMMVKAKLCMMRRFKHIKVSLQRTLDGTLRFEDKVKQT